MPALRAVPLTSVLHTDQEIQQLNITNIYAVPSKTYMKKGCVCVKISNEKRITTY